MKRNLISVIILALCIINFIMLGIIIFTVVPATKKTDNLITSVSSIIGLSDDNENSSSETSNQNVSLKDLTIYTIDNEDTITLKSKDDDAHYAVVQIAVSMNKKSKDFKTYDPDSDTGIKEKESVIESTVSDVLSKYTADECRNDKEKIVQECKQAVQKLFNSDVIYDVSFKKYVIS